MGDELEFKLVETSQPFPVVLVTNKYLTSATAVNNLYRDEKTGVERVERQVTAIHRQWHRSKSKYIPHQSTKEMQRRVS